MQDATPGYLYILRSLKSGKYCVGSTINPTRRLTEHNTGHTRSTRNKGPWEFAAILQFDTAQNAGNAERFVKRLKSKHVIEDVVNGNFNGESCPGFVGYAAIG